MRDLTKEELELAPDWATHYMIDFGGVIYESKQFCWWYGMGEPLRNFTFNDERNRPIPKSFDINNYRSPLMHDSEQPFAHMSLVDGLRVDGLVNKDWAIAIAKALGVTGDDLK